MEWYYHLNEHTGRQMEQVQFETKFGMANIKVQKSLHVFGDDIPKVI